MTGDINSAASAWIHRIEFLSQNETPPKRFENIRRFKIQQMTCLNIIARMHDYVYIYIIIYKQ